MRMLPATPSDAASPRAHSFGNRLLSHTELSRDEETTRSPHGVHAHKLYIPPHMRTHSEDMASITGSDPTANGTPTIGPGHGPGPDCEDKRAPSFQAPCTDPFTAFPHIAPLLEDIMRRVDEQKELLGWVAREVELLKGDFLKLGRVQKLRSAGPTGEAQERVNYHINHSHGPSSTRPLDVNTTGMEFAPINPGPEKGRAQQTERDLFKNTHVLRGPGHPSVTRPEAHQAGMYRNSIPVTTFARNTQPDTFIRQETRQQYQRSVPSVAYQMSPHIYQTSAVRRFDPPRFRKSLHQYNQGFVQNEPMVAYPVPRQEWIPDDKFILRPTPPSPRQFFDEVNGTFDFERLALLSKCSREVFANIYKKETGSPPDDVARMLWGLAVDKVLRLDHEQRWECQFPVEQDAVRRRYGGESRLGKCISDRKTNHPQFDLGNVPSSGTSTMVGSSRGSMVGDEARSMPNLEEDEIELPRAEKWYKDIADQSWLKLGREGEPTRQETPRQEPPREDYANSYMIKVPYT